ncbi:MAG: hypothetical protein K9G36_08030 [Crocinitomicaceae bacterium]|jgi:hypothetical protein|nr:hypothetical protein [Crocinitomicaceae bacterium]
MYYDETDMQAIGRGVIQYNEHSLNPNSSYYIAGCGIMKEGRQNKERVK